MGNNLTPGMNNSQVSKIRHAPTQNLTRAQSGENSVETRFRIPLVRQTLDQMTYINPITRQQQKGVNGKGISLYILEDGSEPALLNTKDGVHASFVKELIQDNVMGSAPGATVLPLPLDVTPRLDLAKINQPYVNNPNLPDSVDAFLKNLETVSSDYINRYANAINRLTVKQKQELCKTGKEPPVVVNISAGESPSIDIQKTIDQLMEKNPGKDNGYKYPNLRGYFFGEAYRQQPLKDSSILQNAYNKIYTYTQQSKLIQTALQNYVDTTKKAAENRVNLVIAMGNEHNKAAEGVSFPDGAEANVLTQSPYVISVAAATHDEKDKNNLTDWQMVASSSQSGISQANPTTTSEAPRPATSAAAPYVSGTVAEMLQVNPNLMLPQIQEILQQAAIKTSETPKRQGAGMLDNIKAVQLAASRNTPAPVYQAKK